MAQARATATTAKQRRHHHQQQPRVPTRANPREGRHTRDKSEGACGQECAGKQKSIKGRCRTSAGFRAASCRTGASARNTVNRKPRQGSEGNGHTNWTSGAHGQGVAQHDVQNPNATNWDPHDSLPHADGHHGCRAQPIRGNASRVVACTSKEKSTRPRPTAPLGMVWKGGGRGGGGGHWQTNPPELAGDGATTGFG